MLEALPGVIYTERALAASASSAATAYVAVFPNPFEGRAYIESIEHVPIEDVTGDDTNTTNYNADLVAGTEIGNLDYPTGDDADRGVAVAFDLSGATAAQRTIAEGGSILIEQEEVGTQPARAAGHVIRVGWKSAGI